MNQLIILSLVILGLPLLSFVLIIFNQHALSDRAHLIASPIMAFSLALSLYIGWVKLKGAPVGTIEWSVPWINFGTVPGFGPLTLTNGVMLDNVTAIMLVVVTLVSFLIHLFSSEYMQNDVRYARYFAYLGLFTFSMIGIVLVNNLFGMFMFWELVGFSSYSLIAHWYEEPGPQYASKKAFVMNRIGDVAMWIGILTLYGQFHTFNFRELFGFINQGLPANFSFLGFSPETTLTAAGILIFCGAVAKSAQFPLHTWLPDAMEGPTPVSALIHAATMVAAGVYLTARIFPILTGDAMLVVACTGAFTSILAASIAFTQNDIKRVLAYSTISQLGMMVMAIGAGAVAAGVFHLVTHAAFKACLFLCAASVIQSMHYPLHEQDDHTTDAQDIRNMGGLIKRMPVTGWSFIVATLAISGIPLFSGFLSKDEILNGTMAYGTLQSGIAQAIPYVGFAVAFLTAFYMGRVVFMVFFGKTRRPELHHHIHESPRLMTVPIVILAALSLWFWYGPNPLNAESGWFLKKWVKTPAQVIPPQTAPRYRSEARFVPLSDTAEAEEFGYSVLPLTSDSVALPAQPMPHQVALQAEGHRSAEIGMAYSLGAALVGFLLAWILYLWKVGSASRIARAFGPIYRASTKGWYLDAIYEYVFVGTFLLVARGSAWFDEHIIDGVVNLAATVTVSVSRVVGWFDRFVIDGVVNLVGGVIQFLGLVVRSIQTGRIQTYMAWTVAGIVVLFVIVQFVF